MRKKPEISLVICTHNRSSQLDISLMHYQQLLPSCEYEILVVVNACTDKTPEIINKHAKILSQLRSVEEPEQGHSKARNRGFREAFGDFVFYMDDDAFPAPNLIQNLCNRLKSGKVEAISGHTSYWSIDSPKWIIPKMVEIPKFQENFGILPEKGYMNGCACGFSKARLEESGGFDPTLGMHGNELGYFDEIYMQMKFKEAGIPIYYDPELLVHHRSHHKTMRQFLKAAFTKGKIESGLRKLPVHIVLRRLIYEFLIGGLLLIPRMFNYGTKAALVLWLTPVYTLLGKLR